jgi:hypothetical protein
MTETFTAVASGTVTVRPLRTMESRYIADLSNADGSVSNGWLGEGVVLASRAIRGAQTAFGADHEATVAVTAYRDAVRDEHMDTTKTSYDPDALHQQYLVARGAIADANDQATQAAQA